MFSSPEWNPIIVRESRSRWRGMGAFWLLLGYAGILAIALFWSYAEATRNTGQSVNPLDRIEQLGHELFLTLIWMQSLAWALIGPAITATSIASERETGMLEAMQLSPLSARQIIFGKLVSALSFIALMLLVSLPITATCFLMGGVSPGDFLAAFALHTTTAFTGAVLGLSCSASSRKANIAMRSAYFLTGGWLIGSLISFANLSSTTATGGSLSWLWRAACTLFGWSNPIIATAGIVDPRAMGAGSAAILGLGIFETSPWLISIIVQLLMCGVLLWSATRALKRPFAEQYWMNPQNILEAPPAVGSTPLADSSAVAPISPRKSRFKTNAREWWLIPIFSKLAFDNPVLQRETRSKFRMRQPGLLFLFFEACLALFVAYFYLRALWGALFIADEREGIWWVINFVALTVVALTSAVSGASAFTREREIKTWEALRLSLVSPREIVGAKLGAILIGFAAFTLPFWPLLLPCIRHLRGKPTNGVSLTQAFACLVLLIATAVCYSLWGMFWSWRCRKTSAATGWTLGSLFFLLVFGPAFLAIVFLSQSMDRVWQIHPFAAMTFLASDSDWQQAWITIAMLLLVSGVLWFKLITDVARETDLTRE